MRPGVSSSGSVMVWTLSGVALASCGGGGGGGGGGSRGITLTGDVRFTENDQGQFVGTTSESTTTIKLNTVRESWDSVINDADNAVLRSALAELGATFKSAARANSNEARITFETQDGTDLVFDYELTDDDSRQFYFADEESDTRVYAGIGGLNYESVADSNSDNQYTVTATFSTTDTRVAANLRSIDSRTYILDVTNVNDNRPVIEVTGSQVPLSEGAIAANIDTGYRISARDLDDPLGKPVVMVRNADNTALDDRFRIDENGHLIFAKAVDIDFEALTDGGIVLTITAEDTGVGTGNSPGDAEPEKVTIRISNVNEADTSPRYISGITSNLSDQHQVGDTVIIRDDYTDGDGIRTKTYSIYYSLGFGPLREFTDVNEVERELRQLGNDLPATPILASFNLTKDVFEKELYAVLKMEDGNGNSYEYFKSLGYFDTGNTRTDAIPLTSVSTYSGGIHSVLGRFSDDSDVDVYSFTLTRPQTVIFSRNLNSAPAPSFDFIPVDSDGNSALGPTVSFGGLNSGGRSINLDGDAGGTTYYVALESNNDNAGIYTFTYETVRTPTITLDSPGGWVDENTAGAMIENIKFTPDSRIVEPSGTKSVSFGVYQRTSGTQADAVSSDLFEVVALTGDDQGSYGLKLRNTISLDHEENSAYTLHISVNDQRLIAYSDDVTVHVTDANEGSAVFGEITSDGDVSRPVDGNRLSVALDNSAPGGGQDPDNGFGSRGVTYRWYHVDDNSSATGTGANRRIYTIAPDDVGERLGVEITYRDGGGFAEEINKIMTATVEPRNVITDENEGYVDENAVAAAISGVKFTPDARHGASYRFEILPASRETLDQGQLEALFQVVALSGDDDGSYGLKLNSGKSFDYEVDDKTYTLKVRVSDDDGFSKTTEDITVDVRNLNEGSAAFAISSPGLDAWTEDQRIFVILDHTAPNGGNDPDGNGKFTFRWFHVDDGYTVFYESYTSDFRSDSSESYYIRGTDVGKRLGLEISYIDGGGFSESVIIPLGPAVLNAPPRIDYSISRISGSVNEDTISADIIGIYVFPEDGPDTKFNFEILPGTGETLTSSQLENLFEVVYSTSSFSLELKSGVSLDYETKDEYQLRVKVTDKGGLSVTTRDITVSVNNISEGPAVFADITSPSGGNVNAPALGDMLTVSLDVNALNQGHDPDGNGAGGFSYQWYHTDDDTPATGTGADTATYTVNAADNGEWLGVKITYTDAGGFSETVHKTLGASVGTTNTAPTVDLITASGSVDEIAVAAAISGIKFTPADTAGTTFSFKIESAETGPEALTTAQAEDLFEVVALTGADIGSYGLKLRVYKSLDHEIKATYGLRVKISDGNLSATTEEITVNVDNINDNSPVVTYTGSQVPLNEGYYKTATNTGYHITASDSDGGTPRFFVLSSTFHQRFEIVDGHLRIKAGSNFDFENLFDEAVMVRILALDTGVGKKVESVHPQVGKELVTIRFTDIPDVIPPEITRSGSPTVLNEGFYHRTFYTGYSYTAINPDGGATPELTLTGDPKYRFELDPFGSLRVKANSIFDYETADDRAITLTITAADPEGVQDTSETVVINIADVLKENAPVINQSGVSPTTTYYERLFTSATLTGHTFTATDADGETPVIFLSGDPWNRFELDANGNLRIKANSSFDYETRADRSITLTITAIDPEDVQDTTETVTIDFTNVANDPTEVRVYEKHPSYRPIKVPFATAGYSLTDGYGDNEDFRLDADGLWWRAVPDYDSPVDGNTDNRYDVQLTHTANGHTQTVRSTIVVNEIGPQVVAKSIIPTISQPSGLSLGRVTVFPEDIPPEHLPAEFVQHILDVFVWTMPKVGPLIFTYSISKEEREDIASYLDNDQSKIDEYHSIIEDVFLSFESVANLKFIEVESDDEDEEMRSGVLNIDLHFGGTPSSLVSSARGREIYIGEGRVKDLDDGSLLHEIGHALGIEHPFDPRDPWPGDSAYRYDPRTIMSYYRPRDGLQPADITALQYYFGAPGTHFEGLESFAIFNISRPVINIPDTQLILNEGLIVKGTDTGYRITASDPDGGTPVVSVSDTRFEIDENNRLIFAEDVNIDFEMPDERTITLLVKADDSGVGIELDRRATLPTTEKQVVINFTNANDGAAGFNITIPGNSIGQSAGDVLTVEFDTYKPDPDGNGSGGFTYRWYYTDDDSTAVGTGASTATYTIHANDAGRTLGVEITYTDGGGFAETVHKIINTAVGTTITAPTVVLDEDEGTVNENAVAAAISGVKFTPSDTQGTTFSFEIVPATGETLNAYQLENLFEVIALSGVNDGSYGLKLKEGKSLDFEAKDSYGLRIRVSDGSLSVLTEKITVNIENLNDGPAVFRLVYSDIPVETNTGSVILDDTAPGGGNDPDGNGEFSYRWFHVDDGSDLVNRYYSSQPFKYQFTSDDVPKWLGVEITYTDGGGFSESITKTFDTIVWPEYPDVSLEPVTGSINENAVSATISGAGFTAVDGWGTIFSFEILPVDGETLDATQLDALFEVVLLGETISTVGVTYSFGLKLRSGISLDHEAKDEYQLQIVVSDQFGFNDTSGEITVSVGNIDETDAIAVISREATYTGSIAVGHVYESTITSDADNEGQTTSYTYQWHHVDETTGDYSPITNATNATYAIKASDSNKILGLEITYRDEGKDGINTERATNTITLPELIPPTITLYENNSVFRQVESSILDDITSIEDEITVPNVEIQ